MSGADFLSEPVISFSVTSISSRWYTLVIFNSWYQIERKLLIRFRSSAFNVFWSQSWAHTLFVCQYLLPHVRSHIVFGSGLLYPLCITDWNLILLDTKFRSRMSLYHLGGILIMYRYFEPHNPAALISDPLFICPACSVYGLFWIQRYLLPIIWLLVKRALWGVYGLTEAFCW